MENIQIARTQYNDKYFLVWKTGFNTGFRGFNFASSEELKNDIQVVLQDESGEYIADAICHYGSYGAKSDLWEVMAASVGEDSVEGHLTWKQVEKHFDKSIKIFEKKII